MGDYDIIIMGAGPAGLTAGIYVGREGLKTKILEKGVIGGNVNNAPLVANFPSFQSITGIEFLKKTAEQAKMYINIAEYEEITKIHKTDSKLLLTTNKGEYSAKALIICSGTTYRKLGIKDEEKFIGRGISYCSICDGMFFKGKEVLVVGGGNSAAEHALHLKDLGCNVKIVHRRDTLRAQKYLQDKIHAKGIPIIWNSIVTELKGNNLLKSGFCRNPFF